MVDIYTGDIANIMTIRSGMSKKDALKSIKLIEEIITDQVSVGNRVIWLGFGSFYRSVKASGMAFGRFFIARYVAKFSAGSRLKRAVGG